MQERKGTAASTGYFGVGIREGGNCEKTVFKMTQKYLAEHSIKCYCSLC